MSGPFAAVTRVAIEELILGRVSESRFGYVLTHDGFNALREDIFSLILTSRTLKAAGDKMLSRDASVPQRSLRGAGKLPR